MRPARLSAVVVLGIFAVSGTVACAKQHKAAEQGKAAQPSATQPSKDQAKQPAMDPQKQAAMEAMKKLGSPSEGHKALQPLAGVWNYTAQWWISPESKPQSMKGTAVNNIVFGGRFLKEEIIGQAEGEPPFEGLGFTGYDNLRKEYQTIWFDNMNTSMMRGVGQFDAATKTLTDQGDFSCPITGETHRWYRTAWTVTDKDHTTYESYSKTPDGKEFKSLEIKYTRVQ